MSEMVSRVTSAIRGGLSPFVEYMPADEDIEACARAVIEAMREPTQPMLEVGEASPYTNHALRLWRQMIDAALSERT